MALFLILVAGVVPACGSSDKGGGTDGCTAADQAACVAADSGNGYGKCIWIANACAEPTAETSCATYLDKASCEEPCSWADNACTGTAAASGLPCSNYTTQVACEIPCAWADTACIVDPCAGKTEADCAATESDNGYGKCTWADGACSAPTVASSCASYLDQASCEEPCTWANDACTGTAAASGLPCSNYTTQTACEIPCGWDGAACVPQ
jgi:hypothetical protein